VGSGPVGVADRLTGAALAADEPGVEPVEPVEPGVDPVVVAPEPAEAVVGALEVPAPVWVDGLELEQAAPSTRAPTTPPNARARAPRATRPPDGADVSKRCVISSPRTRTDKVWGRSSALTDLQSLRRALPNRTSPPVVL